MADKKRGLFVRLFPIISLVVVFITTFLVFNLLFERTPSGSYYQNYLTAIVGSVVIIIVTWVLLSQQSRQDEIRETNVEVFKRKVLKIEEVTSLLLKSLEDGRLDDDEARQLHQAIHELALFCSNKTLKKTANFLRQEVLRDVPEDARIELLELVLQYREELNLGKASADMDQFRLLTAVLSGLSDQRQHLMGAQNIVRKMQRRFKAALRQDDKLWEVKECYGESDRFAFDFGFDEEEDYWGMCSVKYAATPQEAATLEVHFSTENLYAVLDKTQKRISQALVGLGFEPDLVEDDEIAEIHVMSAEVPLEEGDLQAVAIKEAANRFTEAVIKGRMAAAAAFANKE